MQNLNLKHCAVRSVKVLKLDVCMLILTVRLDPIRSDKRCKCIVMFQDENIPDIIFRNKVLCQPIFPALLQY